MGSISVFLLVFLTVFTTTFGEEYRLPKDIIPINYQLSITLDEEAFSDVSDYFHGTVIIEMSVQKATNKIQFHSSVDTVINRVKIDNIPVSNSTYEFNDVTDILTIGLVWDLDEDSVHTVEIAYRGLLRSGNGFYKVSYTDGSEDVQYLMATQMQATFARYAFPCFDEPSFKATFDVSLTYPSSLTALGNSPAKINTTEGDYTTTVFETTPVMSTYLVAFIVSNLTCTEGEDVEGDNLVPYRVCSRRQYEEQRTWALEVGPKVIRSLNGFTGLNYSNGHSKMDEAAVPGSSAGAMENWGLVRYGELALTWHETESTNYYKQYVATVQAHELAHQWFGNLVTCDWWSETFLNEGFATYFEFFTAHEVLPDWQLDRQFVVRILQSILSEDSSGSSLPLQSAAATPSEVNEKFGLITYRKGGSVIRMLVNFLGVDNFKIGLHNYLSKHQFGTTVPENLWNDLEEAIDTNTLNLPSDLNTIMSNWVKKSGYPVVSVSLEGTTVRITQERFLISGNDTDTKWYIPVSYTTSQEPERFQDTSPILWLTPDSEATINFETVPEWIVLNNQQTGFYRVKYDTVLWDKLAKALAANDFSGIHEINRAQIVDDVFNFVTQGTLKYSEAFKILEFLQNDISYITWYPAFNHFNNLLQKVGLNDNLGLAIKSHLVVLMENLRASVSLNHINNTDQIYTLNQVLASTWACDLGNDKCGDEVRTLWEQYKANTNVRPNINLRTIVYCNGFRYSKNPSEDFDFLLKQYQNNPTEKSTFLTALGCSKDKEILNKYLQKIVNSDTEIDRTDVGTAFSSIYNAYDIDVDVVFQYFVENLDTIAVKINNTDSLGNLLRNIASKFTTDSQLSLLKKYIDEGALDDISEAAKSSVEAVQINLDWLEKHREDLHAYYNLDETNISTTTSTSSTATPPVTGAEDEPQNEEQQQEEDHEQGPTTDGGENLKTSTVLLFFVAILCFKFV